MKYRRMVWYHSRTDSEDRYRLNTFDLKYPWSKIDPTTDKNIKNKIERETGIDLDSQRIVFYEWGIEIIEAFIPTESPKEATKIIYDSYRKRPDILYWLSRELVDINIIMYEQGPDGKSIKVTRN